MECDYKEAMKLSNQLCFPLYAASRNITCIYTPYLKELGLTYTQYIALMALWDRGSLSVKELGKILFLDSGTLTPLLKTLESKGFVVRSRDKEDERNVIISLTDEGMLLRERAVKVPAQMGSCLKIDPKDAADLYRILHTLMDEM